jgi:hypothetical protein
MAISSKLTSTNINISSGLILPVHTNDPGDGAVGEIVYVNGQLKYYLDGEWVFITEAGVNGTLEKPFGSPQQAAESNAISGQSYYFKFGSMASPQSLEYRNSYYESKSWVRVFTSPYGGTATVNKLDLSIPMAGLLVQRDTLDVRAAVYWSTPITYNTVGGAGNNTADSGYSPRRVILGSAGGHGIYNTAQNQCSWGDSSGAVGAGWDGGTCGSFPNGLIWGTGTPGSAVYGNRSGTWSHWITWSGNN